MSESYARSFAERIIRDKDFEVLFSGKITRMVRGKSDNGRDAWVAVVDRGGGTYACIAMWKKANYVGKDEDAFDLVDCAT